MVTSQHSWLSKCLLTSLSQIHDRVVKVMLLAVQEQTRRNLRHSDSHDNPLIFSVNVSFKAVCRVTDVVLLFCPLSYDFREDVSFSLRSSLPQSPSNHENWNSSASCIFHIPVAVSWCLCFLSWLLILAFQSCQFFLAVSLHFYEVEIYTFSQIGDWKCFR